MDRQLLLAVLVIAIVGGGCSRKKSPPKAAAPAVTSAPSPASVESRSIEYRTKTAMDFEDVTVSGNLERPSGSASGAFSPASSNPESSATSSAGWQPPMMADSARGEASSDAAIAQRRIQAEEQRRRALAEIQERGGALGAFGTQFSDGGQQPNPLSARGGQDTNPLRGDAMPGVAPQPHATNPLRESRVTAGAAPTALPPPPPSAEPSGGAAPPLGGLAEMERAFSSGPPTTAGGASIEPKDVRATGPAAPGNSGPVLPPRVSSSDDSPYDVVEVLYGTDRKSAVAEPSDWQHVLRCFWPMVSVGVLTGCLLMAAVGRRSWLLGTIAALGGLVTVGLGYEDTTEALALVRGAGKRGPRYTTERAPGGRIELGRCEVTVPRTHHVGELESPSILRLTVNEDVADHLILQKTERLADAKFYDLLRQRVSASARRELFVFVHGFNVSFEDAARRTAQIHYDLKFDGAPIFFSWPARDRFILTYPADEANVATSAPHLKRFLLEIVKESRAQSINLIAHSMGNRALTTALREIELEMHDQARLFNQVILAAPDIDAEDFRNNIAPGMLRTAKQLTLYASAHDEALLASQFIHRGPRAGAAGDGLVIVPGIDTIDVTAIDSSLWGHSYYGSSNPVLHDLRMLLSRAIPPRDRTWLSPAERNGLTYWIFQPTHVAAAEENLTR